MVTADCRAENHGINRITAFLPKSGGIRRRLGNLNAGRWCRGLGWDGMGGG